MGRFYGNWKKVEDGDKRKAGKSQQQIADHLLVTRQAISNWENEKIKTRYRYINKDL